MTAEDPPAPAVPGEPRDIDGLFREHHDKVYRAAYRVTGSAADAEDILQSVFLRALRKDGGVTSNPGAYFCRAAINAGIDLLRSRQRVDVVSSESVMLRIVGDDTPEVDARQAELRTHLRQALGQLNPRAAEVFALRYFEDFGNGEIASMLGTSTSTVAVTLHRAREQMQAALRELEGES